MQADTKPATPAVVAAAPATPNVAATAPAAAAAGASPVVAKPVEAPAPIKLTAAQSKDLQKALATVPGNPTRDEKKTLADLSRLVSVATTKGLLSPEDAAAMNKGLVALAKVHPKAEKNLGLTSLANTVGPKPTAAGTTPAAAPATLAVPTGRTGGQPTLAATNPSTPVTSGTPVASRPTVAATTPAVAPVVIPPKPTIAATTPAVTPAKPTAQPVAPQQPKSSAHALPPREGQRPSPLAVVPKNAPNIVHGNNAIVQPKTAAPPVVQPKITPPPAVAARQAPPIVQPRTTPPPTPKFTTAASPPKAPIVRAPPPPPPPRMCGGKPCG